MVILLTVALADPLLEDVLEVGSVPVYGYGIYPTPPVGPYEGSASPTPVVASHWGAETAPDARVVPASKPVREAVPEPVPEPLPEASPEPEPVVELEAPLPDFVLDEGDIWEDFDIPEVADADPGRETALAVQSEPDAQLEPDARLEPVAIVEAEPLDRGPRPGPTEYIVYDGGTYEQGYARGQRDATASAKGPFIGGTVAGAVVPGCGCLGASVVAALVPVEVGGGDYQRGSVAYEDGYIDGYKRSERRQRIGYAFLGGAIGSSVALFFYASI